MDANMIPKRTLKRLPIYLHYLRSLPEEVAHISATTMAKNLELGDVQVRKDLAFVSKTGRQKIGHSKQMLIEDIEKCLHLNNQTGAVVVGVGNLGQALLEYGGFSKFGIHVLAGFDIEPLGKSLKTEKPVCAMNRLRAFCNTYAVGIGIITVPADSAQAVCDVLVDCGVKAIWNFAPVQLKVPEDVVVHNENLAVSLTLLRMDFLKM